MVEYLAGKRMRGTSSERVNSITSSTFTMSGINSYAGIDNSYSYWIILTNDYTLSSGAKFVGFENYRDTSNTNYYSAIRTENYGGSTTNVTYGTSGTASGTASFTKSGTSYTLSGHGNTLNWTSSADYDLKYLVIATVYEFGKPSTNYVQGTLSGVTINGNTLTISSTSGSFYGSPQIANSTFLSWSGSTATIKGLDGNPKNIWYQTALNTNLLPNIQGGSIYEETDTNKMYLYNSSTGSWTQM